MRRTIAWILALAAAFALCACGTGQPEKENAAEPTPAEESPAEEPAKTELEMISEQLQGEWKSVDAENVYTIWTFYQGSYVADTYVNGEKIPNSVVGNYAIGADAIHTVTIDQEKNVEGAIPYTFTDGVLVLHGANGDLTKEK